MNNPPNPKDKFGKEKPSLQYLPLLPLLEEAVVMRGGAEKYGPHNWRAQPVEAMTYVSAAFRHMIFWVCGQERDLDSLVSHLSHVRACAGIIRDAQIHDTLIDNRPPPTDPTGLLELLDELMSAPHFERKNDGDRAEESKAEKGSSEKGCPLVFDETGFLGKGVVEDEVAPYDEDAGPDENPPRCRRYNDSDGYLR